MKRSFLILVFLAASSGALSAQVSVNSPAFGTVRAGETVKIEWRGLPRGVAELELLLSVDGRELPVRVTPQLAAGAGMFLWRVPNLPSRRARLTVRYGLEGEEIEDNQSASFEILPAEDQAPAALAYRQGEWWTQESAETHFPGSLKTDEDGDRMQENREGPVCSPSSRIASVPVRTPARNGDSVLAAKTSGPARPVLSRRPAEIPARI